MLYSLERIREYEKVERVKPVDTGYVVLVGVFVGALVTSNFTAFKLVNLFGMVLPAAFIAYSITFTCTDVISEVYGRRAAQRAVWAGFAASIAMVALVYAGWLLPPLSPELQEKYSVLMSAPRMVAASMVAYLVSQSHDVVAFHYWKAVTNGRHLWLRNNLSTAVSQALDTTVFITLAFYGVVPNNILLNMIASQYLWKLVVALLDTPVVYAASALLRRL